MKTETKLQKHLTSYQSCVHIMYDTTNIIRFSADVVAEVLMWEKHFHLKEASKRLLESSDAPCWPHTDLQYYNYTTKYHI